MSLFLGTTQIHGVATGDAAVSGVSENLDTELSTQDNLIAQITAALEGKTVPSGSSAPTYELVCMDDSWAPGFLYVNGQRVSLEEGGTTTITATGEQLIIFLPTGSSALWGRQDGEAVDIYDFNISGYDQGYGYGSAFLLNGESRTISFYCSN